MKMVKEKVWYQIIVLISISSQIIFIHSGTSESEIIFHIELCHCLQNHLSEITVVVVFILFKKHSSFFQLRKHYCLFLNVVGLRQHHYWHNAKSIYLEDDSKSESIFVQRFYILEPILKNSVDWNIKKRDMLYSY